MSYEEEDTCPVNAAWREREKERGGGHMAYGALSYQVI
jgi:hypothetical protein